MKFSNSISKSHKAFASVFLAFCLFGFTFPHPTKQVKQNHRANLITTEQATQPERADDGSQYEWFY
jgi:hypothetical protein